MNTTGDEIDKREQEPPPTDQESTEDMITAALAAMDSPLPLSIQGEPPEEQQPREALPVTISPTLEALDESRRPKAGTVCESCPNSVWFTSPTEVRCYCRVMFLIVWSTKEPSRITACDGIFLGQER